MTEIRVFAPAKINLYLHVAGRRDDGYHLLDSLAVFVDMGDDISVAPGPDLSLKVDGPGAEALAQSDGADDNIILRAARALAAAASVPARAQIRLTKRLPTASGIGGGSADAAATLTALSRLWGIDVAAPTMQAVALSLGADVPVCLRGRPARMTGIGEILAAAPPLPPVWLVLTNPGIGLATPAVFKARQGGFSPAMPLMQSPIDAADLAAQLAVRSNDLTTPAIALVPEIGLALSALSAQPGCLLARMSGSGATSFGLFAEQDQAESAAAVLTAAYPLWWTKSTKLISAS